MTSRQYIVRRTEHIASSRNTSIGESIAAASESEESMPTPSAQSISAPDGIEAPPGQEHPTPTSRPRSKVPYEYRERFRRVSPLLPHLQNIRYSSHRAGAKVDCFDFDQEGLKSSRTFKEVKGKYRTDDGQSLHEILDEDVGHVVDTRFLIATDLSTTLIELLGSCLPVNPEMFEEHLQNSGWHHSGRDCDADLWSTRRLSRDYFSMKWFRAVKQSAKRGFCPADREVMLDEGFLEWEVVTSPTNAYYDRVARFLVRYDTNIIREHLSLLTGESSQQAAAAVAWQERATVWTESRAGCIWVLVLTDPLPTLSSRTEGRRDDLEDLGVVLSPMSTSRADGSQDGREDIIIEEDKLMLYEQSRPRGPPVDYRDIISGTNTAAIDKALRSTASTSDIICDFLRDQEAPQAISVLGADVINRFLLPLVTDDTQDVLDVLSTEQDQLTEAIFKDVEIREYRLDRRKALTEVDVELNKLHSSVLTMQTRMLERANDERRGDDEISEDLNRLRRTLDRIAAVLTRNEKVFKSLLSSVSIVESKLGIAEAESVTKLTEIAFFFIPLTFSASVFSMQVKELATSDTSIAAFFVLSIMITGGLYTLRLSIRSPLVQHPAKRILEDIRQFEDIKPGSAISTRAFVHWVWIRTSKAPRLTSLLLICLIMTSVNVVLLATLWTQPLEKGIKNAVTICMCIFLAIFLVWIPIRQQFSRRNLLQMEPRPE